MKSRTIVALLVGVTACSDNGGNMDDPLPARSASVDTSAVTDDLRASGGGVFVELTGAPNSAAIGMLMQAGLGAPNSSEPGPVGLSPVLPNALWGSVQPGGVRALAEIQFVVRVEPSAGSGNIQP